MKFRHFARTAIFAAGATVATTSAAQAYQHNYTCQGDPALCAPGENYAPIVWDQSCVWYYLDRAGSPDFQPASAPRTGAPGATRELEQVVIASFETWNAPTCAGVSLHYGGLTDANARTDHDRQNVVRFRQQDWPLTSTTVFATTLITYQPATGVISQADIHVNNEFYRFSATPTPPPGAADLQNTLTHEAGHLLGIAHSELPDATMYGAAQLGETSKRTLHADDIAALCDQYPARPGAPTCEDSTMPPDKDLGELLPNSRPNTGLPNDLSNTGCTTPGLPAAPSHLLWGTLLAAAALLHRAYQRLRQ